MIIEGTTPTIKYTFKVIDPADIIAAYFTIKKADTIVIEKDLSAATVGAGGLSWTLTQAETLSIRGLAEMMLNWKTQDGTRGASKPTSVSFEANHKNEVI